VAARLRELRRGASLMGFVGMRLPRDVAGLGKQLGLGPAEPAVWHPRLAPSVGRSPWGGWGRHHYLMSAFAV